MNYIGLLVEVIYIFFIISMTNFFLNKKKVTKEEARKIIHIGLSNTYLIACIFFDNIYFASILPFLAIIINYYSYKYKTIGVLERVKDDGCGTVWYAVSIFLIVLVCFFYKEYMYIGSIAILILGYADGFAGVVGLKAMKNRFKNGKSLKGSMTVFIISYIISYVILSFNMYDNVVLFSLLISSYSCIIELLCARGFDNLFLPIFIGIIIYLLTTNEIFFTFSISLCINLMVGLFASIVKALDFKGVIGAVILGTTVHYIMGSYAYISLISYMLLANSISIFYKKRQSIKKETRGLNQVICNGLIPFISAIFYYFDKSDLYIALFLLGLASSCSDTFGGDFGKLGNEKVRYLISRKEVTKGSSGGVTNRGLVGSLIASVIISLFSFVLFDKYKVYYFIMISIFGFLSSIIDSIMGEVVQIKYVDVDTKKVVEKIDIKKRNNYKKQSGIKYVGNSTVNFLSVIITSILFILVLNFK